MMKIIPGPGIQIPGTGDKGCNIRFGGFKIYGLDAPGYHAHALAWGKQIQLAYHIFFSCPR
jgi:hypothetical protein